MSNVYDATIKQQYRTSIGLQAKLERMRGCKSTKEDYDRLKSKEVPEVKSLLEGIDKEVMKLKRELKDLDETRAALQARKSLADQIQTDIILIDKLANECGDVERRIDAFVKTNPSVKSLSNTSADIGQLNDEKKRINDEINM